MTDKFFRELDAWIAENVFDWEWLATTRTEIDKIVTRRAIYPPEDQCGEDGTWVRFNFLASLWQPATQSEPLFSDWDKCCAERDDDRRLGPKRQYGLPHYSTDPAAAMMVLEKCAEKQGGTSIAIAKRGGWLIGGVGRAQHLTESGTLPLAICLFAKKLFEKEKS